ncbi:MAG TPA: rhodanese-like domain-containing protein [Candidatus Thermoplasmatota archaeon]|nr:rhodanese-like domain-containing protein [Candidatus Thermoplasmatota archaeon]
MVFNLAEHLIIDVRTREEYAKDHIKGALNIALHDLEFYHEFLKDKTVSVYCNSGVRARLAQQWLRAAHINADVLKGNWENDYLREKRGLISAIDFLEIKPGNEKEFQEQMKTLCQKTNEIDGFLGSKLLHISGVSGIGSFLPDDISETTFTPDKYIIITYWRDKDAHNKSHHLTFFKQIYDQVPRYSAKMPYEEFYEILK